MIACKCGKTYKPKVPGDIRCLCGSVLKNKNAVKIKKSRIKKNKFDFLKREKEGAEHWDKLHKYPVNNWGSNVKEWFENWEKNIPHVGCSCKKKWSFHKKEHPPDFSSRENFFRWTVIIHNEVNKQLNKPQISFDEAREIHGF